MIARKIATKTSVQIVVTRPDARLSSVRMAFIVDAFSAKIGFLVVDLEVDQRAEHLQVRDQRVHLGRRPGLAVKIAHYGLRVALGEVVGAGLFRIRVGVYLGAGVSYLVVGIRLTY